MPSDEEIVALIIDRYGPVIDLVENPRAMIDILRVFRDDGGDDGGTDDGEPGGGVPEPPDPCAVERYQVELRDIMKAVLELSRDVGVIMQSLENRA
jgi:hypothetical protein